jgi:hypothetical protein
MSPVWTLENMAGTTRLALATSAVTVSCLLVNACNYVARMATKTAFRDAKEQLLDHETRSTQWRKQRIPRGL